jgi:hypothetical protein
MTFAAAVAGRRTTRRVMRPIRSSARPRKQAPSKTQAAQRP